METQINYSLLELLLSLALLITWFVVVAQVIAIKKTMNRKYSYLDAEHDAEICRIAGDNAGYLKNCYKALYYYWLTSPHFQSKIMHNALKIELKDRYYNVITKAGGKYPEKYLPVENVKEALNKADALRREGKYTQAECDAEKARILGK